MLTSSQSISRENKREIAEKSSQLNIPEDVVVEILSKLPAKSLLRFKAVSKIWHSTISNPSNFHGKRCPATRIFAAVRDGPIHFLLIDQKGSIEKFRAPDWCQLEAGESRAVISNSCNGILLLCLGKRIFLVNPSTRYIERVLTLDEHYKYNLYNIKIGFCYDESISDYKAIIFRRSFMTSTTTMLVSSLKEKQWTELHKSTGFGCMLFGPVVNDRLHATDYTAIVSFNPIKDVFEEVVCPHPKSEYKDGIVSLGVLDGCLCMVRRIPKDSSSGRVGDLECLVMKVYGVAESWITLFVLETEERYYRMEPLFRTENGDILIKHPNWITIWKYSFADKSCTKFMLEAGTNYTATFVENLFFPHTSVSRD